MDQPEKPLTREEFIEDRKRRQALFAELGMTMLPGEPTNYEEYLQHYTRETLFRMQEENAWNKMIDDMRR